MKGVIKTFVPEKKFGFIKGDDGKDYFFHQNSFKEPDRINICDDAFVDFDPVPTPKGYRAENCSLKDASAVLSYVVPDEFLTSKTDSIRGWDVIEVGNWIVHGTSRDSPDAAKKDLIDSAMRVRANALICVEYYKDTGSEAGTGRGFHHYTIHNFCGKIATAAKKSPKGTLHINELLGLNQRAETEKRRLAEMTSQSRRKRNIVWVTAWGAVLGAVALQAATLSNYGASVFVVMLVALVFGVLYGRATDYDHWLQRARS